MARRSTHTALSGLSVVDLHRELAKRQRGAKRLDKVRSRLAAKLAAIDAEIAALGGSDPSGRDNQRRNSASLMEALKSVLDGKTMSVGEAAEAVRAGGYRSAPPNFRIMVNQALLNKSTFKRTGRGQYTLK